MGESVLLLGGGVGGLVVAHHLRKRLPKEHRVTIVEREASFVYAPSLLWLLTGDRTAEKISRPLGVAGKPWPIHPIGRARQLLQLVHRPESRVAGR